MLLKVLFLTLLPFKVIFSAALCHWSVTLYEDWVHWAELPVEGLTWLVGSDRELAWWLGCGYTIHHLASVFTYGYLLFTPGHQLGALGCFGLGFEVPLVLLNLREVVLQISQRPLSWSVSQLYCFYAFVAALIIVFRAIPIVMYIHSVLFWMDELMAELNSCDWYVYHTSGILFLVLSVYWVLLVLMCAVHDIQSIQCLTCSTRDSIRNHRIRI